MAKAFSSWTACIFSRERATATFASTETSLTKQTNLVRRVAWCVSQRVSCLPSLLCIREALVFQEGDMRSIFSYHEGAQILTGGASIKLSWLRRSCAFKGGSKCKLSTYPSSNPQTNSWVSQPQEGMELRQPPLNLFKRKWHWLRDLVWPPLENAPPLQAAQVVLASIFQALEKRAWERSPCTCQLRFRQPVNWRLNYAGDRFFYFDRTREESTHWSCLFKTVTKTRCALWGHRWKASTTPLPPSIVRW